MMIFYRIVVLFTLTCLIFETTAQTSTDIYLMDIKLQDYNLNYKNLTKPFIILFNKVK